MAGIEKARLAARIAALALGRRHAVAIRKDGLERGRRHRADHLDQMGAALDPTQKLAHLVDEALADAQPLEALEIGNDRRAHRERAVIGGGLDRLDRHRIVERQAQPHLVNGLARLDAAAMVVLEVIGLGVDQMTLDVP